MDLTETLAGISDWARALPMTAATIPWPILALFAVPLILLLFSRSIVPVLASIPIYLGALTVWMLPLANQQRWGVEVTLWVSLAMMALLAYDYRRVRDRMAIIEEALESLTRRVAPLEN